MQRPGHHRRCRQSMPTNASIWTGSRRTGSQSRYALGHTLGGRKRRSLTAFGQDLRRAIAHRYVKSHEMLTALQALMVNDKDVRPMHLKTNMVGRRVALQRA